MSDAGVGAAPPQVLVVGADADAVAFVTAMINRAGIVAISSTSGHAAATANANPPGVVLVDRDLAPVRSIRALADPRKAATPIVVLGSEGAEEGEADEAQDAGATHYVPRPITEAALLNGLRSILGPA